MRLVIILGVAAVIVAGLVAIAWIVTRPRTMREIRAENATLRREIRRHDAFLRRLHQQALRNAPVDPVSAALADDIGNHLAHYPDTKEKQ